MDNNLENNDWKKEAPELGSLPVYHSFSVPEGYFEHLPTQIINSIYLEKLKSKVKETGFSTPPAYFDRSNERISAEIFMERLKEIAPVCEYPAVPANYFEQLQANILARTVDSSNHKNPSKIIRLFNSNILKYASAACFLILSATGLYYYQQQQHDHNTKLAYSEMATEQMLYDIDEQVIIDHIEANGLEHANPTPADVELENYILNNYTQSDIASDL